MRRILSPRDEVVPHSSAESLCIHTWRSYPSKTPAIQRIRMNPLPPDELRILIMDMVEDVKLLELQLTYTSSGSVRGR